MSRGIWSVSTNSDPELFAFGMHEIALFCRANETHFSVLLTVADERAELAGIRVLVHLDQAAFVELEIKIENNGKITRKNLKVHWPLLQKLPNAIQKLGENGGDLKRAYSCILISSFS